MELSAVGESVFAAESILKRRIRRVFSAFAAQPATTHISSAASVGQRPRTAVRRPRARALTVCSFLQGRWEYLVKWKGWSQK